MSNIIDFIKSLRKIIELSQFFTISLKTRKVLKNDPPNVQSIHKIFYEKHTLYLILEHVYYPKKYIPKKVKKRKTNRSLVPFIASGYLLNIVVVCCMSYKVLYCM